jgi:hypothetical protein
LKIKLKTFLSEFLKKLKNPNSLIIFIFLAWLLTFVLCVIAKLIFGNSSDDLMNYNPLFNGFIHGDPSHLFMNLGLIFIFLVPPINQHYNFTEIFYITLIISLVYFPISMAVGIPAVGISGTMYFMMTRVCLNKKNILLFVFFAIMFGYEIANYNVISDGVAHGVHIIGVIFGFISLNISKRFYHLRFNQ